MRSLIVFLISEIILCSNAYALVAGTKFKKTDIMFYTETGRIRFDGARGEISCSSSVWVPMPDRLHFGKDKQVKIKLEQNVLGNGLTENRILVEKSKSIIHINPLALDTECDIKVSFNFFDEKYALYDNSDIACHHPVKFYYTSLRAKKYKKLGLKELNGKQFVSRYEYVKDSQYDDEQIVLMKYLDVVDMNNGEITRSFENGWINGDMTTGKPYEVCKKK